MDLISPKIDVIFKKMFTENIDLLKAFLCDMLDFKEEDVNEITILNTELIPNDPDGKFSRIDLNLKLKKRKINIEIQIKYDKDYKERSLFYWAKVFTGDLKSGQAYSELKQTITVNIIDFELFEGSEYHTEVVPVVKGTNQIFSEKMQMHFFELKKVGKEIEKDNRKRLWMQFFNAKKEEEFNMLTKNDTMEKAVNVIYSYSKDEEVREIARQREEMLIEKWALLAGAKNEGLEEGKVIGREEGIEIGREEGIRFLIESYQRFGMTYENTIKEISEKYKIDITTAEEKVKRMWHTK